ncbi:MAG: signal peptidase II [Actinomycetota bacterium]|nr:signal peptidase II [Actinomycetota bacterium]
MLNRAKRNILMNVYFLATAILVLVADQVTKSIIIERVPENSSIEIIRGLLYITHVKNSGAAFGMFQGYTNILAVVSIVAIVLIIILKVILKLDFAFYNVSLGFILGGAIGNLIDRYFLGEVTDFINLSFIPVFNIADFSLIVGFCLIIILIIREYFKREKARRS